MNNPILHHAIREQLKSILASEVFSRSRRMQRFLQFVVEETLAGREDQLGEYAVGVAVFDRGVDFEPGLDPIVRNDARRLRLKLLEYYNQAALPGNHIVIEIPKGGYVPVFRKAAARVEEPVASLGLARCRITVQLMQSTAGGTGWADEYEFEVGELLAVQTKIAANVLREVTARREMRHSTGLHLAIAA